MSSLLIVHRSGRTHKRELNFGLPMASVYRRATYRCAVPPLDIRIQAVSLFTVALSVQL
ncbi:MAG: hypothetical protein AB4426_04660 [Xenococcaceae cyanobacterium]